MKALFGGVSLLVVLALVAWLAVRQLKTTEPRPASVPLGASAPLAVDGALPPQSAQERVRADIDRAMQDAADARRRADGQ